MFESIFGNAVITMHEVPLCPVYSLGATMGSLLRSRLMVMISPVSDMMVPVEGMNVPMILPKPSLTVMFVGAMR